MSVAVHESPLTRPGLVHGIFAWSAHSLLASWMSVGSSTLIGFSPAGRAASEPVAAADADDEDEADAEPDADALADEVAFRLVVAVGWSVGVGVGVGFAFANGNVDATAAMMR